TEKEKKNLEKKIERRERQIEHLQIEVIRLRAALWGKPNGRRNLPA
ncbi:unnamed protein product, partial [marine sediment metagenome]